MIRWVFLSILLNVNASAFERIVTLTPEVGEWSALVLGKDAEKKIVGVSEFTDEPEELQKKEKVGAYASIQIEKIISLKPDLIIGAVENNRVEQIERLRSLKLNVALLPRAQFKTFSEWIIKLGEILKDPDSAQKWADEWKSRVQALHIQGKEQKVRVFVEIQHNPLITIGRESFLSDALDSIGFENVFRSLQSGYPKISIEAVLREKPEVLLIMDQTNDQQLTDASRAAWARFKKIPAIQNQKIEVISGNDFGRFSLRLLNALKKLESKYAKARS